MKSLLCLAVCLLPGVASAQVLSPSYYYQSYQCHPKAYRSLMGQDINAVYSLGLTPGPMVRVFGPGAILSDEFNPYRLNVVSDDGRVVTRIYCG
ncbi:I78 family peptidase inhibitor [Pseudooceanicola sp. C21-150M6]|uniref:I78 family peptidase inhibitor n=1 Tax=Pseudooceanicola sp. C21-150M6 TaxID=3434355 RepID=UPI003D7FD6E5